MIIKDSKMGTDAGGQHVVGTRYITLAPGQAEAMVPVAIPGREALAMMSLRHGHKFAIVDDDSPAEGVTADLAKSLIDKGLCVEVIPAVAEAGTSLADPESAAKVGGGILGSSAGVMLGDGAPVTIVSPAPTVIVSDPAAPVSEGA